MPKKGRESSSGGFLLGKASRLSGKVFSRILRDAGLDDFEPGQGRIYFLLKEKGPLGQKELAILAGLDKSSLALTLDRMEAKGLVVRRKDGDDARRSTVEACAHAAPDPESYTKLSQEMTDLFYEGFSASEREAFEAMLGRVIGNLEKALGGLT